MAQFWHDDDPLQPFVTLSACQPLIRPSKVVYGPNNDDKYSDKYDDESMVQWFGHEIDLWPYLKHRKRDGVHSC